MDISQIDDDLTVSLPYALEEQYTSIQRLSICHYCSINELTTILSYTPHLSHLYSIGLNYSNNRIEETVLMKLNNLVHLTLHIYDLDFDQFEEFIRKFSFNLRKFVFSTDCLDKRYLNGDRWEQLIVEYMPYLNIFDFRYVDDNIDDFEITSQYALLNRFNSAFWIKHQWFFSIRIEIDQLIYRVRPYAYVFKKNFTLEKKISYFFFREDLFDLPEHKKNSSIHNNPGAHMSIGNIG